MKLMLASDIHGSAYYCRKMLECYKKENADKLVLLGDILYHGPRNDLPEEYAPKQVIAMLNPMVRDILCVRGNCDAFVDRMVLEMNISSDYLTMWESGHMLMCTHGHLTDPEETAGINEGDAVIYGHTHIYRAERKNGVVYVNPGSVSLPKNGNPPTYCIYEDGVFTVRSLDGEELVSISL